MEPDQLVVKGARQHNLKNITVRIPKKKLVVFTGVSGSGKSSLAFDTLYAEGQRRYVESLSSYARQFLGQMDKPLYDTIRGLSPTISVDQKSAGHSPRSTIGTITEIYDYLRVLYARIGKLYCHSCGRVVSQQSSQQIVEELLAIEPGRRFQILAPLVTSRKGEHREIIEQARRQGFSRIRVDGVVCSLEEPLHLEKKKKHNLELVVDRLVAKPVRKLSTDARNRLADSVETALRFGNGVLILAVDGGEDRLLSEHRACHYCGLSFPELTPQIFSFNSPQGMCSDCNGLGTRAEMDVELMVPDPSLSVNQGALKPWGLVGEKSGWTAAILKSLARHYDIDLDVPWARLGRKKRDIILFGSGGERISVRWKGNSGHGSFRMRFEGLVPTLMRRMRETQSETTRRHCAQFLSNKPCSSCGGSRLRPEARAVRIGDKTIADVASLTIDEAFLYWTTVGLEGTDALIGAELLKEVVNRLRFLRDVGLGYLSLDRLAPSLSGGEAQRIRLASQIGSELTGVVYILDEPSIGLHPRDNHKLIGALRRLRDVGNTVIVVEHDRETIEAADHLIDFGPGAGVHGGEIVATGSPEELRCNSRSLTGRYLSGKLSIPTPRTRRRPSGRFVEVLGARENNLQDIDCRIPLGVLVAVTGVSGAGKSTLVSQILYPSLARSLHRSEIQVGAHRAIRGLEHLDKVIDIDQSPIGRTPRSNPATYTKVFDEVRRFFANLPDARIHGYSPGRFSFNVKGGRCDHCLGDGVIKVEMHFLPDVYVPCEVCKGRRFNEVTLQVRYKGHSIADVLDLTVAEAARLFENHPAIRRILETLTEVGLGYIRLGQSSPTLSGGEAQRVKLSRELAKRSTGRTLYILDEPTTGLHFDDIARLLQVLDRLVEGGNTVVVIEHNLDVIKTADYLIDLGPEGGDRGGCLVAAGTPEEVARNPSSYTGQFLAKILSAAA
ncbi:MAG: excinuclease ABC subunit UvrA [Acidobacteriota bacterium]